MYKQIAVYHGTKYYPGMKGRVGVWDLELNIECSFQEPERGERGKMSLDTKLGEVGITHQRH